MLIKCSSCGAQAKLPDSKEGAKVKCPSCSHVYVARPAGRGGARVKKDDPTKYFVIGGIALGAVVVAILASGGKDELPQASEKEPEVVKETKPYVDPMLWDGPTVTLARQLHDAVRAGNRDRLANKLDGPLAYGYVVEEKHRGEHVDRDHDPVAEAAALPPWDTLTEIERIEAEKAMVDAAMLAGADGPVAGWIPFDGRVESLSDGYSVVRLRVQAADTDAKLEDRWTQWVFHNSAGDFGPDDAWKWVHVDRWLTPGEAADLRKPNRQRPVKTTLSDGSVVFESEIREIPFPEDVPEARRAELTALVEDYVSDTFRRPSEMKPLRESAVQAGKEIVPALLTKMAQIKSTMSTNLDENLDDRVRLNWIHELLRDITGYETTFDVATEMGGTEERIESGLKQWFAWYDRRFKRFEGREDETVDPLAEDLDKMTPEERRQYERAKREIEAEREREKAQREKAQGGG